MTRPRTLAIISEIIPCAGPIEDGQRLVEDRGADSLDFAQLHVAIENEFGIALTDEEGCQETVGEWVATVQARVAEKRRAA